MPREPADHFCGFAYGMLPSIRHAMTKPGYFPVAAKPSRVAAAPDPLVQRVEAHAVGEFRRPLDVPDGKIAPLAGLQSAGLSGEVSGDEPGLQSLATAIATPWRRRRSIGGTCVSRRK